MVKAYHIGEESTEISLDYCKKLGVLYWKLDPVNYEKEGTLDQICKERNYKNRDEVDSQNIPNLDEKLEIFFQEHIHEDEEIRFFLKGSGYFDVRDGLNKDEKWLRLELSAGEMIVLPPGIYHRFTADETKYFHVMRLFKDDPKWTALNRSEEVDKNQFRVSYITEFLKEA